MKISRRQAGLLRQSIQSWHSSGLLDDNTFALLEQNIEVSPFDWKRLAKYSFWIAILCIITSAAAILSDKYLIELLKKYFNAPYAVRCVFFSILSIGFYWLGIRRKAHYPLKVFSNEALLCLGVLATAGAIYQLREAFKDPEHFSTLLLISFIVYGILGYSFKSNLIWLFSLLSLGGWLGTETGYMSEWGGYFLGMNYPLRFVLFGGILTTIAFSCEKINWFKDFFRITLVMGLLYLFIALWITSIFGNHSDLHSWYKIKQIELFHWSLLFAFVAVGAIYHGLRFDNGITKGFGITFLFLNLYTRFFEYFWNTTHKAIFFGLLAISFWFLGIHAEKIWSLGKNKIDS